jgi:hypothetical protein
MPAAIRAACLCLALAGVGCAVASTPVAQFAPAATGGGANGGGSGM